jgi:hypothetical protein
VGLTKYGPKEPLSTSIGDPCPLCGVPFKAGDFTALIRTTTISKHGQAHRGPLGLRDHARVGSSDPLEIIERQLFRIVVRIAEDATDVRDALLGHGVRNESFVPLHLVQADGHHDFRRRRAGTKDSLGDLLTIIDEETKLI